MDTFTALENYRLREKIEELFAVQKGRLDGARPRTWYPDNLRGRQFTQFVSLGYHCFLIKKIKQVQARLGKKEPGKTKSLIKLEKKLENWLDATLSRPDSWIGSTALKPQRYRLSWAAIDGPPNQWPETECS